VIAKRILRDTAGRSDFSRLAKYVLTAQGRSDPSTWVRTADYVLDTAHGGAKVGTVRVTNCKSEDPAMAVAEIKAIQARNTRSKTDKTYHLVISFPPGERPEPDQLRYIEDELCAAIGFADHQRLSAVHTDTDHLHVHVAINKVNPKSFSNIEPYFDYRRLMQTCARLEVELNLERTHDRAHEPTLESTQESHHAIKPQDDREQLDPRAAAAIRKSYLEEIAREPEAQSLHGVRTLSSVGVVQLDGGGEVLLSSDASHHVEPAGAQRNDGVRWGGDGPRGAGARRRQPLRSSLRGRPNQMEAHSSRESLLGYIQERAREGALAAQSWPELHRALATYGLRAHRRGAGLVIGTADGLFVKASEIDRRLSLAALSKRFGAFEAASLEIQQIQPQERYQGQPKESGATQPLFATFVKEREAALLARATARERLREAHRRYAADLAVWYTAERQRLRADKRLRGRVKFDALRDLSRRKRNDFLTRRELEKTQLSEVRAAAPLPTWAAFLEARAAAGDTEALQVLRSRAGSRARARPNSVHPEHSHISPSPVLAHLMPRTRKNGDLVYLLADGGVVIDATEHVRIEKVSDEAVALALTLATVRFSGQRLLVDGSADFGLSLARAARHQSTPVEFADAALEQERCAPGTPSPGVSADTPTAIEEFVAQHNHLRSRDSSLDFLKVWTPSDAGSVVYLGVHRLNEGSPVLLLKRSDTTLVMRVSEPQASQASAWTVGATVQVEEGGDLRVDRQRGRTR
jgi:hypothetical protein